MDSVLKLDSASELDASSPPFSLHVGLGVKKKRVGWGEVFFRGGRWEKNAKKNSKKPLGGGGSGSGVGSGKIKPPGR